MIRILMVAFIARTRSGTCGMVRFKYFKTARDLDPPKTHLGHHKVAGTLLNRDLAAERERHLLAIPLQTEIVVLVAIEKVHLAGRLLHARMQIQHLQQRPGARLADADDQSLRQPAARLRKPIRIDERMRQRGRIWD